MSRLTRSQLVFIARQHFEAGRLPDAEGLCRKVLADEPGCAGALHLAGLVADRLGRHETAAAFLRRAANARPDNPDIHVDLGHACRQAGQIEESITAYRRALELAPDSPDALSSLTSALNDTGPIDQGSDRAKLDAAVALCSAMIVERAESAQLCFNAAGAFQRGRHVDAAISAYRRALELDPNHIAALNNLSLALKDAGRLDEAIACSREAVKSHPHISTCHGNLLYSLHFDPDSTAESLYVEHRRWAARHAEPLKTPVPSAVEVQIQRHEKEPSPDSVNRRLRIGYVSPNFNVHPVGRFLRALFANHDHQAFEIVCYSSVRRPDAMTDQFRNQADRWVDATHLTDKALAERIRADRIDILVDLTMHMADSRLLVFALKPAPIQVTYLAYCSTTGLDTIDYRITDPWLDPPDRKDDGIYTERSVHLPQTYWCYDPAIEAPDPNPLPALSRGHVTFASLNNFCKASPAALDLWAALLRAVPGSQLILHALRGAHRAAVLERFAAAGVDPGRLRFFDLLTLPDYFKLHHWIDLALDPFPYPGGTTTCDALWMGVPTVSLVGNAAFTRSGLSILTNARLPGFATHSQEQYLKTAIALAGDLPRLAALRAGLREQMRNSPLMNGPRFALDMESLYRSLWRQWCVKDSAGFT